MEANKLLITLMIEFWQTTTMTFQFTDFEITPTLEEISQIVDLPLVSRAPLTLHVGNWFSLVFGFESRPDLRRVDEGWVKLNYLFKRFDRRESYDRGPVRVTIVLMILAEIFRSLSLCSRGYDQFKGSNLLLQIWALEHFYQRLAENGTEANLHNKIRSHAMRLSMWDALNNEDGWRLFLTHLTGNHIQWRLPWVHGRALLRTNHTYFIELIGLEGFQPYAPLRVLRQFRIT
ncbi:hypothetical protein H5410_040972 [Solanum commersonii]|uniref:Aminotransferase-like plant mobile domain-containing protein n=1 Tax=Solanum commersonii TaxID=4109 RepID=A0A9J5XRN9_SOLCO|nr:hypothetical protein H5410_040972 [Solanum commersonii]